MLEFGIQGGLGGGTDIADPAWAKAGHVRRFNRHSQQPSRLLTERRLHVSIHRVARSRRATPSLMRTPRQQMRPPAVDDWRSCIVTTRVHSVSRA